MEKRSMFEMIFGKKEQDTSKYTELKFLNNYKAVFSKFNGQLYQNDQVRSCIDVIARNCAKLNPKHIRYYYENGIERVEKVRDRVNYLVSVKPNELMNAYSFYYKIASQLELWNNCFIFIQREKDGTPTGLYPIEAQQYKLLEYKNEVYVQFKFKNNVYVASLKDDIIHLKQCFVQHEVLGDDNEPIIKTMSIKHIINEGIINAIKTTQGIKGILKEQKAMLNPKDAQKKRDDFVKDFITNGNGGIAFTDATTDFKEVNINPQTATDGQVKRIDDEILDHFGLNQKILQSSFNEEEWNAFYENKIQPFAIQVSQEFTNKIFSYGERMHGNEIVLESDRLEYVSNKTKISLIKEAGALGLITRNEGRRILGFEPVENGDNLLQSLNYTDIPNDEGGNKDE